MHSHSAISICKVRFRALFAIKRLAHANKECESEASGWHSPREGETSSSGRLTTAQGDTEHFQISDMAVLCSMSPNGFK